MEALRDGLRNRQGDRKRDADAHRDGCRHTDVHGPEQATGETSKLDRRTDVFQMFRGRAWKVIDAVDAFEDPIYRSEPNILPAGESILWALAKEKGLEGLRYPGEDGEYEKPILDRLGL